MNVLSFHLFKVASGDPIDRVNKLEASLRCIYTLLVMILGVFFMLGECSLFSFMQGCIKRSY